MQIFLAQRTHHVETVDFSETGSRPDAGSLPCAAVTFSAITFIACSRHPSGPPPPFTLLHIHDETSSAPQYIFLPRRLFDVRARDIEGIRA